MKDSVADAFQNRLQKMEKHQAKWARRNHIEAYRIFDRDIPGVPFSIDRYGEHIYVCEYKKGDEVDDFIEERNRRVFDITSSVLAVPPEKFHVKGRKKQKGLSQYEKTGDRGNFFTVTEGELRFYVNLDDYLDTGLFLDHRTTRSLFRDAAKDRDVLNLFAYTGSFSVYAASGGARSVTTVDLSYNYLDWASDNFELNGLSDERRYHFHRDDVIEYLEKLEPESFDLIMADVPTFSNSKSTKNDFDVLRDQNHLVELLLRASRKDGIIFFSTNFRRFKPDPLWFEKDTTKEITKTTIPRDFRNDRIHRCFRIVKGV